MVNIEIDGRTTQVENGRTIMDAANALGIFIPYFCYHSKLTIAANCRMCLVQVEKAPKPLPACATPVVEGMKVQTHSEYAVQAQKGVMEFLLINHPLDCPICDQGGECQLQDLAVGYGASASRYTESKRVVTNKDLGPLIATDMTRCIYCTRCVRFGQEVAGVMELGMAGRGEHAEILSYMGRAVESELSGNVIDLCPVGALTSKPFRYRARNWELTRHRSISPHGSLGANLIVQAKQNRVLRVLPMENESINECWLSDKDRFAYEGLNSPDRLTSAMLKRESGWIEADWTQALEYVTTQLKRLVEQYGAEQIGALATPHQTLEELFLLQKLMRGLGSDNVDHRLRQSDFRADAWPTPPVPWLGLPIAELSALQSVLVVGSTLRKDHPLLTARLRRQAGKGLEVNLINPVDDDLLLTVANKAIVAPDAMVSVLAQILKAVSEFKGSRLAPDLQQALSGVMVSESAAKMARSLSDKERSAILLGNLAQHHPSYSCLLGLAQQIAAITGARFGVLGEAANSVGGYIAGAIPSGKGKDAQAMLATPRKAYLLLGVEAELDCHDPQAALTALRSADFVVALSMYQDKALDYAHVLLSIAPFSESGGTFVNCEGTAQSFIGAVKPLGNARPAWKVLRVLANLLGLDGFDYESIEDVRREMGDDLQHSVREKLGPKQSPATLSPADKPVTALLPLEDGAASARDRQQAGDPLQTDGSQQTGDQQRSADQQRIGNQQRTGGQQEIGDQQGAAGTRGTGDLQRIGEVPIYQTDAIVRRSAPLQRTHDAAPPVFSARLETLRRFGLQAGESVRVRQGSGSAVLQAAVDEAIPAECARIPAAHPVTAELGPMFGRVSVEKIKP
jgi:NADH-quinone oxidoreductase subunit G